MEGRKEGTGRFSQLIASSSTERQGGGEEIMERGHVPDYFFSTDQEIPNCLIGLHFWWLYFEVVIKLVIKYKFCIKGFSTSEAILGLWLFSLTAPTASKWEFFYLLRFLDAKFLSP